MYRIPAPITMANASASLDALVRAIDGGESEVALDALAHSDSSAVAVLLVGLRRAHAAGRTIRFSAAPPSVRSLARLYGVDTLLGTPHAG